MTARMVRPTVARVDLAALKSNYGTVVEHLARVRSQGFRADAPETKINPP